MRKRDSTRARINDQITSPQVRLIDQTGDQLGVVDIKDALAAAEQVGLDLVEISPTAQPPVCRVMDHGKFQFEQRKRQAEAKKKLKQFQIKEIKLRPTTEQGDYLVKLRNVVKFLENGDKVKISLRFRGREVTHQEIGMRVLLRMIEDTADVAQVEQQPKREGRQLLMVLTPKKR